MISYLPVTISKPLFVFSVVALVTELSFTMLSVVVTVTTELSLELELEPLLSKSKLEDSVVVVVLVVVVVAAVVLTLAVVVDSGSNSTVGGVLVVEVEGLLVVVTGVLKKTLLMPKFIPACRKLPNRFNLLLTIPEISMPVEMAEDDDEVEVEVEVADVVEPAFRAGAEFKK